MTAGLPTKAVEIFREERTSEMNHSSELGPATSLNVDLEWARLIVFAKELGLSYEEIKHFLDNARGNPRGSQALSDKSSIPPSGSDIIS